MSDDMSVPLPDGWVKTFTQRKGGATIGSWDVYMAPPNGGKRLRSNPELIKYCKERQLYIDPAVVNMVSVLPKDHK